MLATEARINKITPMNNHLPRPCDKSFLTVPAKLAIPAKITAVPPKAVMIKLAPLLNPRIEPIKRESIRPMKNVKPSNRTTPRPESLFFSIAQKKPNAIAKNAIKPMKGLPAKSENPVATPIHAPNTVGTIDNAKSA